MLHEKLGDMNKKRFRFQHLALGGTFDHFHSGHEAFLTRAAQIADHVDIGIVDDAFLSEKQARGFIEPFAQRQASVKSFWHSHTATSAQFIKLGDLYGNTLSDSSIDGMLVTPATLQGAQMINQTRQKKNLPDLEIVEMPLLKDDLGEGNISSSRIRLGEISRSGIVWKYALPNQSQIKKLSETQKRFLKEKQGIVVTKPSTPQGSAIVVGDVVLQTFLEQRWPFSLGLFDQRNQRQPFSYDFPSPQAVVENPRSHISGELVEIMAQKLHNFKDDLNARCLIEVQGEEDLAAVVAVLLAPLQARVYYGQPGEGIVEVIVTEAIKQRFYDWLMTAGVG
jgi:pantetheine-phosphate adenylyltransferase